MEINYCDVVVPMQHACIPSEGSAICALFLTLSFSIASFYKAVNVVGTAVVGYHYQQSVAIIIVTVPVISLINIIMISIIIFIMYVLTL